MDFIKKMSVSQKETASAAGNAVLAVIVAILGGLGVDMHRRLVKIYTPEQKSAKDATAGSIYAASLALMILGVLLAVGCIVLLKVPPSLLLPELSADNRLVASVVTSAVLVVLVLTLGALGVKIYDHITDQFTEAQKDTIPASTKHIYNTFFGLMVTGAVIAAALFIFVPVSMSSTNMTFAVAGLV